MRQQEKKESEKGDKKMEEASREHEKTNHRKLINTTSACVATT